MKATLVIEGKNKVTVDIGFDDLSSIVSSLPDEDSFTDSYAALALHPSASVRESVASKDKIDEATVNVLAVDREVLVLRSLLRSEKGRECLQTERLLSIINMDVECADNIASYVERFDSADSDKLAEALVKHADPRVRNSLAENSSAPKKFLKILLKDQDSKVRNSAKRSLE